MPAEFTVHVRIPSWTRAFWVRVNGQVVEPLLLPDDLNAPVQMASGYSPYGAFYVSITRAWSPGDSIELDLPMPIVIRRPHRKVKGNRGRHALTRGPLVYCLESIDNPEIDVFGVKLDLATLRPERSPERAAQPLWSSPMWVIRGQTADGRGFTAIPYFVWANRGASQMTVMVRA